MNKQRLEEIRVWAEVDCRSMHLVNELFDEIKWLMAENERLRSLYDGETNWFQETVKLRERIEKLKETLRLYAKFSDGPDIQIGGVIASATVAIDDQEDNK